MSDRWVDKYRPYDVARDALEAEMQRCADAVRECDDSTSEYAFQTALANYVKAEKAVTEYNHWRAYP